MADAETIIVLIENIAGKRVSIDENLNDKGILDSITRVDLALEIEKKMDKKIPFQFIDAKNFSSVSSILNFIRTL